MSGQHNLEQENEALYKLRHSTAHVMAQAVQDLFPDTRLGIGPPITDGFYYDFEPPQPFTAEDLAALQKRMVAIVKGGQRFSRRVGQSAFSILSWRAQKSSRAA